MLQHVREAGLLRIPDAARFLGVSRSKLYLLMDCGELAFVKLGKARRVPRIELEKLIERHTTRCVVDLGTALN